ncbi:hypothetical protein B0H16DRAFT_1893177 [Mycena metata]|uniref:Uncharacterized protein n=1 Tax=Mycena metata TaxID=1033252 RepID=A0AAD7MT29_9AGAR|nr:hypothetical protein B0H16DRAFT_1893177 [Mycena metata]
MAARSSEFETLLASYHHLIRYLYPPSLRPSFTFADRPGSRHVLYAASGLGAPESLEHPICTDPEVVSAFKSSAGPNTIPSLSGRARHPGKRYLSAQAFLVVSLRALPFAVQSKRRGTVQVPTASAAPSAAEQETPHCEISTVCDAHTRFRALDALRSPRITVDAAFHTLPALVRRVRKRAKHFL